MLAVIFGIIALRQIGRTGGQMAGQGLAIAGLVIGLVGLTGTVVAVAVAPRTPSSALPSLTIPLGTDPLARVLNLGDTAHLPANDISGMRSIAVYSVTAPSTSGAPPAEEFVAAKVRVCAGPNGSVEGAANFNLTLKTGATVTESTSANRTVTTIPAVPPLGPNACKSGYVTFNFGTGGTPSLINYLGTSPMYAWRV